MVTAEVPKRNGTGKRTARGLTQRCWAQPERVTASDAGRTAPATDCVTRAGQPGSPQSMANAHSFKGIKSHLVGDREHTSASLPEDQGPTPPGGRSSAFGAEVGGGLSPVQRPVHPCPAKPRSRGHWTSEHLSQAAAHSQPRSTPGASVSPTTCDPVAGWDCPCGVREDLTASPRGTLGKGQNSKFKPQSMAAAECTRPRHPHKAETHGRAATDGWGL